MKVSSMHNPKAATGSAAHARRKKVKWGPRDVREEPLTWLRIVPLRKIPRR